MLERGPADPRHPHRVAVVTRQVNVEILPPVGIAAGGDVERRPLRRGLQEAPALFETYVSGAIAVTQAMLPLLREAPAGRIVNVSSSLGSLAKTADPANPARSLYGVYSATKTALNMVTAKLALELEATPIKVNAACPGYTATDLNGFQGTRTVEEGAREPVRLALLGPDGPTGTYSDDEGTIPW